MGRMYSVGCVEIKEIPEKDEVYNSEYMYIST
jgi:hypothetical protein